MQRKNHYQTKQKSEILDYMKSACGKHVTVNDICKYFDSIGFSIGTTTVYRQLESLVDEGLVTKYTVDGKSGACFEYIGDDNCHEGVCIHCKCDVCGKVIHLHCDEFKMIENHILSEHGFNPNSKRTVIYGVCSDCRK